jgi:hypothetical protein
MSFNFALGYAISMAKENQQRMELNGTNQLLVYANVNLLGKNINAVEEKILKLHNSILDLFKPCTLEIQLVPISS